MKCIMDFNGGIIPLQNIVYISSPNLTTYYVYLSWDGGKVEIPESEYDKLIKEINLL